MKPYANLKLHLEAGGHAAQQATIWATSNPVGAAAMAVLAKVPIARWLGAWDGRSDSLVVDELFGRCAVGELPVFVWYYIPHRDGDGASKGGAADAATYRTKTAEVAAGFKGRLGLVVLEPDALAMITMLSADLQAERLSLISGAVDTLKAAGAKVYIDAGDSNWIPSASMAALLLKAGAAKADGFALNVSHTETTANSHAYAAEILGILGTQVPTTFGYLIDTGRNGLGAYVPKAGEDPDISWENPPGRGNGVSPNLAPRKVRCHALLWVKNPGESDGPKFGGGPAGAWWPEYALGCYELAVPPWPRAPAIA